MDSNPIDDLENKMGQVDTGRASYLMFTGALSEGATLGHAYLAVAAYYCGMFSSMGLGKDEEEDEEASSS